MENLKKEIEYTNASEAETFSWLHYLTFYALMDSTFWFDTIVLGCSIWCMEGSQVIISASCAISSVSSLFAKVHM